MVDDISLYDGKYPHIIPQHITVPPPPFSDPATGH